MEPTTTQPQGSPASAFSALDDALALIALGPQRSANAVEWYRVSLEMCKHCKGTENVNEAAARIVAERMKTYDGKLRLLTKEQHRMRDPKRTLLCDIIANGQLLPDPNGSRYGQNTTLRPTPETDALISRLPEATPATSAHVRAEGLLVAHAIKLERERDEAAYKLAGFEAEVAGLRAENEEMRDALAKLNPFTTP